MNPGDRVWLLPDKDKREVKSMLPGVVVRELESGRVRVSYVDMRCILVKTVDPSRVKPRDIYCADLKEKVDS